MDFPSFNTNLHKSRTGYCVTIAIVPKLNKPPVRAQNDLRCRQIYLSPRIVLNVVNHSMDRTPDDEDEGPIDVRSQVPFGAHA